MIVYTPLNLPKLEPDNWEVFWNIWNTHSDVLVKKSVNIVNSRSPVGSNNVWVGLDIFSKWNLKVSWDCPYYDISNDLPVMRESIDRLNLKTLYRVRLIQSMVDVEAHTDNNTDRWNIRGYLHYTSTQPQWYFTKPRDTIKTYSTMPNDLQWFGYNDKYAWHGSDYDPNHKKILIQLFFLENVNNLIQDNINVYKEYTIEYV
jgi:hypothetical protein